MKRSMLAAMLAVFVAMMGLSPGVSGAPSSGTTERAGDSGLEMYRTTVDTATFKEITQGGFDVAAVEQKRGGVELAASGVFGVVGLMAALTVVM